MATVTATNASPRRHKPGHTTDAAAGFRWRAAIIVCALLAGAAVVLAQSTAQRSLDEARALVQQGKTATDPAVQDLVRRALERDVSQPAALELTALAEESGGDRPKAAQLYQLSNRISRRSLATRLWLVQDAVARGDVKGALVNMDLALRTSSAAPGFVFPALSRGLEDPALVAPIAAMVDRPSDWREMFLYYAVDHADPASAAALLMAVNDRRTILKDELDRKLTVRLADAGRFALARRLDEAFGGREPAATVADDTFGDARARYPFGWGLTDKSELGATRATENGRPALAYHANPGESGQVAAQLLMLAPGSYLLASRSAVTQPNSRPLWTLSCAGSAKLIATLELGDASRTAADTTFSVPQNCPAQWLVLNLRTALVAQSGAVQNVTIEALSRSGERASFVEPELPEH
jgi:hypothetical protein